MTTEWPQGLGILTPAAGSAPNPLGLGAFVVSGDRAAAPAGALAGVSKIIAGVRRAFAGVSAGVRSTVHKLPPARVFAAQRVCDVDLQGLAGVRSSLRTRKKNPTGMTGKKTRVRNELTPATPANPCESTLHGLPPAEMLAGVSAGVAALTPAHPLRNPCDDLERRRPSWSAARGTSHRAARPRTATP